MRIMLEEDLATCPSIEAVQQQTQATLAELQADGYAIAYVAGPISADGEQHITRNIGRLVAARGDLMRHLGRRVLPFTAPFVFTPQVYGNLNIFDMERSAREETMQRFWDTLILSGVVDELYFVTGWQRSPGARRERQTAEAAGIPTFDFIPRTI